MTDLSHIQGIIWDLDDTLYSVTEDLHESMRQSVARAVVKMGYPISYEDALKMAEQSQHKHRMTVQMLVEHFEINPRDLHLPFHAEMDHMVITPCVDLPTTFARNPHIKHTLMTHASREWGVRMLDHLGIADFFDPKAVFGLEDLDFEKKDSSDRATKTCLAAIGVNPENAAFAEDRDWNLTIPHRMGLTTVLIDHPSHKPDPLPHVHYRFKNAGTFMDAISSSMAKKSA